jgi:membrane protein DedA with SNARE-associated domain
VGAILFNLGLLASQNLILAYFIVYIATIFFGNISAFTSFWVIIHSDLGEWSIPFLMLAIFLSNLTGDLIWYSLGKSLRDTRFGHWIRRRIPNHEKIEHAVMNNGRKWMFFSKFLYGSSFPIVFSIGWTRTPFKKFFRASLLSILAWLPILLGLAYGLTEGLSPLEAVSTFQDFEWLFLIALVLFLVADYALAKILRRFLDKKGDNTS